MVANTPSATVAASAVPGAVPDAITTAMPTSMFDPPPSGAWESPPPFASQASSYASDAGPAYHSPPPARLALWTPMVAVYASFFLSTVFGGWIYARNWRALHQPERAKTTMQWSIAIAIVEWIASLALPQPTKPLAAFIISLLPALVGTVFWYFYIAKEHVEYVAQLSGEYEKRGWAKPVLIAIGIILLSFIVMVFLYFIAVGMGIAEEPR